MGWKCVWKLPWFEPSKVSNKWIATSVDQVRLGQYDDSLSCVVITVRESSCPTTVSPVSTSDTEPSFSWTFADSPLGRPGHEPDPHPTSSSRRHVAAWSFPYAPSGVRILPPKGVDLHGSVSAYPCRNRWQVAKNASRKVPRYFRCWRWSDAFSRSPLSQLHSPREHPPTTNYQNRLPGLRSR